MNRHRRKRDQGGAALLIAMVMIFMVSIMGVSVMRTASLEKRMASNAIQSATAMQAAESATEQLLNDTDTLRAAAQSRLSVIEVDTESVHGDIGLETDARIVYIGDGPAFGFSSDFMTLRLVAQGESRIDAVRSRAVVRQGARRVVPSLR